MGDAHETSDSSLPDLPSDDSHGSSVSSRFENEYDEILKYALVAPRITIERDVYTQKEKNPINDSPKYMNTSTKEKDVSFKVNPNYKEDLQIQEAKRTIENVATNNNAPLTLESLLEYSTNPNKESCVKENFAETSEQDVSSNSLSYINGIFAPANLVDKTDKGLLRMDGLMDEWCLQLKRNVLAEMVDMKGKILQDEEIASSELKFKHNLDIQKLQHEVDSLKELLFSFEQNVKQKDEMIANLTQALEKQKEKSEKIRMFSIWRLKLNDKSRQEFASKMADKFYQKTICTKVWAGWRSVVENKWKVRVEKACQIRSQEVCLKLTEDYEERLQELQNELSKSRADLSQLHRDRESYEENMKKTFMRGVCALNMEAMSMFKEGCSNESIISHQSEEPTISQVNKENEKSNCNQINRKLETRPEITKRHTKFNTQSEESMNFKRVDNSLNKNLNVKLAARKSNISNKRDGASHPSTISSIKVERHIPPEASGQKSALRHGPTKSCVKPNEHGTQSIKKPLLKTVKVVD